MAPIIVQRATMASPGASSRSGVSLASVVKSFSRTAAAALAFLAGMLGAYVAWPH